MEELGLRLRSLIWEKPLLTRPKGAPKKSSQSKKNSQRPVYSYITTIIIQTPNPIRYGIMFKLKVPLALPFTLYPSANKKGARAAPCACVWGAVKSFSCATALSAVTKRGISAAPCQAAPLKFELEPADCARPQAAGGLSRPTAPGPRRSRSRCGSDASFVGLDTYGVGYTCWLVTTAYIGYNCMYWLHLLLMSIENTTADGTHNYTLLAPSSTSRSASCCSTTQTASEVRFQILKTVEVDDLSSAAPTEHRASRPPPMARAAKQSSAAFVRCRCASLCRPLTLCRPPKPLQTLTARLKAASCCVASPKT